MKRVNATHIAIASLIAVLVVLGLILPLYWVYLLSTVAISALIARSVGLVTNQTGLVTLCQMSFAAIGGWVVSWIALAWPSAPFPLLVLLGGLAAAPVGWLLGAATGLHPDAELACQAIKMAVATRGGKDAIWRAEESERVIFHTDRGSTYTAHDFTTLCRQQGIRQSMGRVGSCFDNAAAEAFFSSLEWEVLSRHDFATIDQARAIVLDWCYGFYNHDRRHSTIGMLSPINYETSTAVPAGEAA